MSAAAHPTLLDNVLGFARALRRAGMPVGLDQAMDVARALEWIDIGDRLQVFHTARALLVRRREDLALFTLLFHRFWQADGAVPRAGQPTPRAPRHDPGGRKPLTIVDFMAMRQQRDLPEIETIDRSGTASGDEILQRKDFSALSAAELEQVRRLIAKLRWQLSERQTRRYRPDPRGKVVHLRRTLAAIARRDALPARLPRRRRTVKQRPIVLLADISGSMEKYARLVLQLFYGISHAGHEVESFVFGTRLTRVTAALRLRNVDRAVDQAAEQVVDWSGGTRIGQSLATFNRRWGRRVLRRGAVVMLISDGLERGGVDQLATEMRHLQHRCHRLIWLNPLLGGRRYQPTARGMAAALPFVDDFLPVHNLRSLQQLGEHLQQLPRRRGSRAAGTGIRPQPTEARQP